jgi:hypothetical protein
MDGAFWQESTTSREVARRFGRTAPMLSMRPANAEPSERAVATLDGSEIGSTGLSAGEVRLMQTTS